MRLHYENTTDDDFPGAYRVQGWDGIAWSILGWETEPIATWSCQDCSAAGFERSGGGGGIIDHGSPDCEHEHTAWSEEPEYERTGRVVGVMIGDDKHHSLERADIERIDDLAYCAECGQIGCRHDGRERAVLERIEAGTMEG